MRRRRATPRGEGRAGRSSVPPCSGTGRAFDDSDLPIDDLPPDDLPVRDITDDLDEPHPAPNVRIQAVDQGSRDPAEPAPSPEADSAEPIDPPFSADHAPLRAALQDETAGETSSLDPHPRAGAEEALSQYTLPGLGSEDGFEAQLDLGKKKPARPRQPRSSSSKAMKAAQIELWPDDEGVSSG